jgi:hypothetical protein
METNELIERVARAMAEKSKARVAGVNFLHSMMMDGEENFMELARAAIEEMRENAIFQGELPDGAVIEGNQFTGDLSEVIRSGVLRLTNEDRYAVHLEWPEGVIKAGD